MSKWIFETPFILAFEFIFWSIGLTVVFVLFLSKAVNTNNDIQFWKYIIPLK